MAGIYTIEVINSKGIFVDSNYIALSNWDDLEEAAGINVLTGEACAYSLRNLCDVNESGKELLQDYFGMPALVLASPWNSMVKGQPSVGSIMLGHELFQPLGEFYLARKRALGIVYINKRIAGGIFSQELLDEYLKAALPRYDIKRLYSSTNLTVGSRNVHATTCRVI
jgi:hypothetical protein